jgi:hypothetical protein
MGYLFLMVLRAFSSCFVSILLLERGVGGTRNWDGGWGGGGVHWQAEVKADRVRVQGESGGEEEGEGGETERGRGRRKEEKGRWWWWGVGGGGGGGVQREGAEEMKGEIQRESGT